MRGGRVRDPAQGVELLPARQLSVYTTCFRTCVKCSLRCFCQSIVPQTGFPHSHVGISPPSRRARHARRPREGSLRSKGVQAFGYGRTTERMALGMPQIDDIRRLWFEGRGAPRSPA